MKIPAGKWTDPWTEPSTGWMLLSYNKPVDCSSADSGFPATQAVNEDVRDYWAARADDTLSWLLVDLETICTVNALQINFAEHECQLPAVALKHQYKVLMSADGTTWVTLVDRLDSIDDVPHDYTELESPVQCRYLKIEIHHMPTKGRAALSGLRVFGKGSGDGPAAPVLTKAKVQTNDPLTAEIRWDSVPGAIGYNVRWGISPKKLYHDWLVYDATGLDLTAINNKQPTWVAVEAFNENGVSMLGAIRKVQQ